ncbi:MAG: peptidase S24 [Candidatus Competibacteraceae bacterium]|nr:peptidase S24 [Candidatus Competibacteraceae bacterium]
MGAALTESLSCTALHPAWLADLETAPNPVGGWPLLATPVSAGLPAPADGSVERRLSLDAHLIRHPEATFLMRVQGNELRGQGIQDGDLLIVDRTAAPSTGSLVVAVIEGKFALRRVDRDAQGRRVLQSVHADVPDQFLSDQQDLQIWGVVRWNIHRLWPGRLSS